MVLPPAHELELGNDLGPDVHVGKQIRHVRHHADDGLRGAIEVKDSADDIRIARELRLPEPLRDHDLHPVDVVLLGSVEAPHERSQTERGEDVLRDAGAFHRSRFPVAGPGKGEVWDGRGESIEGARLSVEIIEVRSGNAHPILPA